MAAVAVEETLPESENAAGEVEKLAATLENLAFPMVNDRLLADPAHPDPALHESVSSGPTPGTLSERFSEVVVTEPENAYAGEPAVVEDTLPESCRLGLEVEKLAVTLVNEALPMVKLPEPEPEQPVVVQVNEMVLPLAALVRLMLRDVEVADPVNE